MTAGVVIDLESVIASTSVLSLLASTSGFGDEVQVLVSAVDAGILPIEGTLNLCGRLLGDYPLTELHRRVAAVSLDQHVLRFIESAPDRTVVVTKLPDAWLTPLASQLACPLRAGDATVEAGFLVSTGATPDKAEIVRELGRRCEVVVAVGGSSDDASMLEAADLRVVFGDSPSTAIRELADYYTPTGRALWNLLTSL